jgi:hypothetical protein
MEDNIYIKMILELGVHLKQNPLEKTIAGRLK